MEMYPAILMHILVEIWGNPYEIKNITLSLNKNPLNKKPLNLYEN